MTDAALTAEIQRLGQYNGLDTIGVAAAAPFRDYAWADSPRRDPRLSLPGARSIIVAGVYIGGLTLPVWSDPCWGRTSRLYLSGFFLDVVAPLAPIADLLQQRGYSAVVCNSGAQGGSVLPLKLAAVRAGLGWQGKHSLLISKTYGTFLALGGIITDADLVVNERPEPNRCRTCDLCQQACPLDALERPHCLNHERCLSYRLQEADLGVTAQAAMANRVGDCEICQIACPWNRKHLKAPLETRLTEDFRQKRAAWEGLFHLPELARLTEADYQRELGHLNTQIRFSLFQRNVRIALKHAATRGGC